MNYPSLIPYVLALLSLAGFLFTLGRGRSSGAKQSRNLEVLENDKQEKREALQSVEMQISELIRNSFNKKWSNEVFSGFISEGMPTELLQVAWGRPADIKEIEEPDGRYQFWFYEPVEDKNGATTYKTNVKVKDNKIVEWLNT